MKLLVVGLDGATPEMLLGDERLTNVRRLMEGGCYGRLETVIPPGSIPGWLSMATSRDPGSLGVYGSRDRPDRSYRDLAPASTRSMREPTVWDEVAREGGRVNIIGVPPGYPPRPVPGISVGCFLTPDPGADEYALPASARATIARLVGDYPVDVKGFRTDRKGWLRDEIHAMTRKHFQVIRHFLRHSEWDYFQLVEIGLDRLQHGFWRFHDPDHAGHEPGHPYQAVIRDYYQYLDDELGGLLDLLGEETAVLVLSAHGVKRRAGGFCLDEWLVREGLLAPDRYPQAVTPLSRLAVNWERTTAWSEGGHCARVYLNVKGREPRGAVDPADYDRVRDELQARIEALTDEDGRSLGARVQRPEAIYREVRNVAPDLIVHLGELSWRSVGGVGHPALHVQEDAAGPDDCNHARHGSFILAAPGSPLRGEIQGAHIMDMAPTLLELGGYDVPTAMQGVSLLAGRAPGAEDAAVLSPDDEAIIRERLRGLGYIS